MFLLKETLFEKEINPETKKKKKKSWENKRRKKKMTRWNTGIRHKIWQTKK